MRWFEPVFLIACFVATGCGPAPTVVRVVGSRTIEGPFVSPEGYSTFLRAVVAERDGKAQEALALYKQALSDDSRNDEALARMALLACRSRSPERDDAAKRVASREPTSAALKFAEAECARLRGDRTTRVRALREAFALDPSDPEIATWMAREESDPIVAVNRLLALTLQYPEREGAWSALVELTRNGDQAVFKRAIVRWAGLFPSRGDAIVPVLDRLAREGEWATVREVAAAYVDNSGLSEARVTTQFDRQRGPVVVRWAIDEALLRRDRESALRRARIGHVGLGEVAARGWLLGWRNDAVELAREVLAADASNPDALVVSSRLDLPTGLNNGLTASGFAVFATRMEAALGSEIARARVATAVHDSIVPEDDLVVRRLVDLAAGGVVDARLLPAEGTTELALRRGESVNAIPAAFSRVLQRNRAPREGDAVRLLRRNAADPIVARAALDLAESQRDAAAITRAKAVLRVLARTDYERKRAQ